MTNYVGIKSDGQGNEAAFAQCLQDRAGCSCLVRVQRSTTLNGHSDQECADVTEVVIDCDVCNTRVVKHTPIGTFSLIVNTVQAEDEVKTTCSVNIELADFLRDKQWLTASFMDYAMRRTDVIPMIHFASKPGPSTAIIRGVIGRSDTESVCFKAIPANTRGVWQANLALVPRMI